MTKEETLYDNLLKQLEQDNEPEFHVVIRKEDSLFLFYLTHYIDGKTLLHPVDPVANLGAFIQAPWLYNKTPISYRRKKGILKTVKEYEKSLSSPI